MPDERRPDAGEPDAGQPDAGEPDARKPDAREPDTGEPAPRWSVHQVTALAPDAASVSAAHGLASGFSTTGRLDDILWGYYRGYQVCVDLAGPAFRCSCPSRKVPCKHALGLLLRWAEQDVSDASAPPFAEQWHAARRAKAQATPKAVEAPDPVAAARRAQQRVDRVGGGMAELRRWLDDQLQHGLAGAQRGGPAAFETMAARLVDAQAPAAAAAVRRLGFSAGVGAHWADHLLSELALLRLLVRGYERLAELPSELAATVRTRVGFPVSAQSVLAGPRVSDRWQVLGQVDSDDGALTTRRTWLHGVTHRRFAMVLAFAAPGQSLPADLLVGTEFRGDLVFYPGAAPLRALVAERASAAEPFATPVGGTDLSTALAGWSAAVAADPWRHDVPVLLAEVVPSADGWLVDATGAAVPLAPGHDQPWWLLAAAGGHPATVAGEWSPAGLRPLGGWVDGSHVPAPVIPPGGARGPELPAPMLAAALVGTNRRPWSGPPDLLESAAIAVIARRVGVTPGFGRHGVPPAPGETSPAVPTAAGQRLGRILVANVPGGARVAQALLGQWLTVAAELGGHAPPRTLPALLDTGRRDTTLRTAIAQVAGQRGRWLAAMHADWRWLRDEASQSAAEPATATLSERLGLLATLRRTDPDRARELVSDSWATASADERVRLVEALAVGLDVADDDLLERALDDRRREVREAALELCRRLPGSSLRTRMAERARACVRLVQEPVRIEVVPPEHLTAELRRDGVGTTPARGIGAAAWLLEEILAGTSLTTWLDPPTMLRLARDTDWTAPLLHGWAKAAATQRAGDWATVLLAEASATLRESVRWDLHLALPPDELDRVAAAALRRGDALATRLLAIHPGQWADGLCVVVLETVAHRARTDRHTWQLGELCHAAALGMPPAYADLVGRLAGQLDQQVDRSRVRPVADLARTLRFRADMMRELGVQGFVTPAQ